MVAASELPIDTGASATEMAETIFGEGVTVVSASYTGDSRSSGTFSDGDSVAPGVTPADTGVMLSTGRLSAFTNSNGQSNQSSSTTTGSRGPNNDADFNALAGTSTYDASFLDVDFIPTGDTMSLQFVFASEEYPEFANSIYNDIVGVWVNGQPAEMTIGGTTAVGTVNPGSNENLYVDNTGDQYNTEMDGFTVTMTLTMSVNADELNSIRIGIADVGDSSYDSTLIIAAESAQTAITAADDTAWLDPNSSTTIDVLGNDSATGGATLVVTHINGIAVSPGDTVLLTTGQTVRLNADGTLTIIGDGDIETVNFSYTIAEEGVADPVTDTAYVTINSIPCFVAGTLIATPTGEVPVERFTPGDLVLTHDNGPQPLRWVGRRQVRAEAALAPVRIAAGALGNHRALLVSPLHRILIRDALAELLFGEPEVLVAAKDLVNDRSVRVETGGMVDYVHILFEDHQVVFSEGLATESYLPGPQTRKSFEQAIAEEIFALFPELDPATGAGFPAAARRTLRSYEARLLSPGALAAA